jgi:DNA-binding IclR family transcriptional regulator
MFAISAGESAAMSRTKSADDNPSTAVERALAILEATAQRSGMTNAEISRKLRIPKSSASYLLRTLERGGYLRREREGGQYRLGLKVLSLSHRALADLDFRQVAQPILRQLVESSKLTAHLAVLDQGQAVYIEKADAPGFIKMDTWVGRRMDLHSTSVGKALAAYLPAPELEAILKARGLNKRTPLTITAIPRLLRELEKVRHQGYAVDEEENNLGVRCVAAPVFNTLGEVEASVGLTGTVAQLARGSVPKVAELVREAARKISQQMGYSAARRP